LIQRLVPYSKPLQGSALHIAFERSKLMAMFPSPIKKKNGNCGWFFTMAPPDKYEHRTAEVIQHTIKDDSITAWEQRTPQAVILSSIIVSCITSAVLFSYLSEGAIVKNHLQLPFFFMIGDGNMTISLRSFKSNMES
jgi:hypothetical protein